MDELLCLGIGDAARVMRRRFDERARTIGVTRQQWQVLTKLARAEGIHQGRLAELLDVEPITLCRMLDRLADAGLIERRRDPADRRAWNIHLTARSRPLLDRLATLADGLFADALTGLGEADKQVAVDVLARIRSNLSPSAHETAAHG